MQQPMLETREDVVPAAVVVVTDEQSHSAIEPKAVSLRRAATAMLFFSLACARPWPTPAWLGVFASFAILCAPSSQKLLCRARCARCLSAIVAIFAFIALIMLGMSLHSGMPDHVSTKVLSTCNEMPAETFVWAQAKMSEHKCMRKFLSRHAPEGTMPALALADNNATHLHLSVVSGDAPDVLAWSQPEACDKLAYVAARMTKMMMLGSALGHLLLLLSAVAVVKRACRLRCAAYRAGLLQWSCKWSGCKTTGQPAAAPVTPAAKEMA